METHSIELNKKRIARLRNEIALKQREVEKLEGNLAASKERKLENRSRSRSRSRVIHAFQTTIQEDGIGDIERQNTKTKDEYGNSNK